MGSTLNVLFCLSLAKISPLRVQAVLWCGQDLSDFSSVGALVQVLTEMASARVGAVLAVVVLVCALGARADGSDHKYKEGDHVPLYANKVGPFHNPRYSKLLQCTNFRHGISVILHNGVSSPYNASFNKLAVYVSG